MSRNSEIILLPHWVHEAMQRNRLPLETCLNFDKMRSILSATDLAGFLQLQEHAKCVVGGKVESGQYALWHAWSQSCMTEESKAYLTNTFEPLSRDPSVRDEVLSRLFSEDAKQDRFKEPFITYDIAPGYGGVVIYPGFFTSTTGSDLHIRAVEAILELLYVYTPYHKVSSTSWFQRYLELLSSKQIVA